VSDLFRSIYHRLFAAFFAMARGWRGRALRLRGRRDDTLALCGIERREAVQRLSFTFASRAQTNFQAQPDGSSRRSRSGELRGWTGGQFRQSFGQKRMA
jgi:hypothetical protein